MSTYAEAEQPQGPGSLMCPVCQRDYEIPVHAGKHVSRKDDVDFSVLPRLLPCLHSVCQSCLEDMRQRDINGRGSTIDIRAVGKVICPVCMREEPIKNPKLLPLDLCSLSSVLKSRTAEILSCCSRCYDETPSFSWCTTCSASLCEFHHQDHKLSLVTTHHNLKTFKELNAERTPIFPKLAPVTCPEEPVATSCSCYCSTCCHLISANAALHNHKGHKAMECSDVFPEMKKTLVASAQYSSVKVAEMLNIRADVQETIDLLDDNAVASNNFIQAQFDEIRKELEYRQAQLTERLSSVYNRKRGALSRQFEEVLEAIETAKYVNEVTECVLQECQEPSNEMYAIGMTDAIEDRTDELEAFVASKPKVPIEDASLDVAFNASDFERMVSCLETFGSVHSTELDKDILGGDDEVDAAPQEKGSEAGQQAASLANVRICFVIKTGTVIDKPLTGLSSAHNHLSSASADERVANQLKKKITIEARVASFQPLYGESKAGSGADSKASPLGPRAGGQGPLLGKIVLSDELNRSVLNRHELRAFFESLTMQGGEGTIPVMRITKEFLPAQDKMARAGSTGASSQASLFNSSYNS